METTPTPRAALRAAAAYEWRSCRRDPAWWGAVALLAACVAFAAESGRRRVDARAGAVAGARADEARRLGALTGLLGKIGRGEAPPPDAPFRDPSNALYVGRGQGAAVAARPDAPLAFAAVGLSDLEPAALKVSAASKDAFLFADEIENPAHLLGGGFDLDFVIAAVLPILIVAVAHDLVSADRERGTLALAEATGAPAGAVALGRLLARAGGLVVACGLAIVAAAAAVVPRAAWPDALPALGGLLLATAASGAFWGAVCLAINAFGRDSAFNAAAGVAAWTALVVAGPAAAEALAEAAAPAPPRSDLIVAVRRASVDAENAGDPAPAPPGLDARTRRTLATTLAADATADAVLAEQEAALGRGRRLAGALAWLLPPALVRDAVAELSGNGRTRRDDFLRRVADFHARFRAFFVEKARAGAPLTLADYDRFPRFEPPDAPASLLPEGRSRVATALAGVIAWSIALGLFAARRLGRPA